MRWLWESEWSRCTLGSTPSREWSRLWGSKFHSDLAKPRSRIPYFSVGWVICTVWRDTCENNSFFQEWGAAGVQRRSGLCRFQVLHLWWGQVDHCVPYSSSVHSLWKYPHSQECHNNPVFNQRHSFGVNRLCCALFLRRLRGLCGYRENTGAHEQCMS